MAEDLADLTGLDVYTALGLPIGSTLPPPGRTMDDLLADYFLKEGAPCDLRSGDHLELLVDALVTVMIASRGPGSGGATARLRAGTELEVAGDPVDAAVAFPCRPTDYDNLEVHIVPDDELRSVMYGGYAVLIPKKAVGHQLRVKP